MATSSQHTYSANFRLPQQMWNAYGRIAERLNSDRTQLLLEHIRADFLEHGDEQDLADLAAAEKELTDRRSRKGGRPPKNRIAS